MPAECFNPNCDPASLIDISIEALQALTSHFEDEVAVTHVRAAPLRAEDRASKEALLMIGILIPKLQMIRRSQLASAGPFQRCLNCDD